MASRVRVVLYLMSILTTALLSAAVYRTVLAGPLTDHPGNTRPILAKYKDERGEVFAADGSTLITNEVADGGFKRVYPGGATFAAVTGYFHPLRGRGGLEAAAEQWLSGTDRYASFDDWLASTTNGSRRGYDLTLTIDPELQKFAAATLSDRPGAIVALDPRTGALKAMVGFPTYDPNHVGDRWDEIVGGNSVLVNRPVQSRYPPGSTFKIVTAAAALDAGIAKPSSVYDGPAVLPIGGGKVTNFADQEAGRLSLRRAFAKSTNTIFAQLGLELGAGRLSAAARGFGVWSQPPFDLPVKAGSMADPRSMDKVMLAWSAVGQGETLVTPLEMALVAGGIAERGNIYAPYMLQFARDYRGVIQEEHKPEVWRRATSSKTAKLITDMMVDTVATGTGRAAALSNVSVAGKTGTAEVGGGLEPHAWFVGFAPADDPKIAVAVLIEHGGLGGRTAAPAARAVIEKALNLTSEDRLE